MDIGERIKKIRTNKNLTQEELARASNISKNAIWNYENNKRQPSIETLKEIASSLKVNINDLLLDEPCYSKKLIDELEYPILQSFGLVDTLEILSNELKISYDDLENTITKNIELSIPEQYKLFKYFSKIDTSEFMRFCDENMYPYIKRRRKFFDLYMKVLSQKLIDLEEDNFSIFRKFIFSTFGDKINKFLNEDTMKELHKETEKFLEFNLYKIEKNFYGENEDEE